MDDWTDVAEAVAHNAAAYNALMKAREDERAGTKALQLVEDAWLDAVEARAKALDQHWTEEDGWLGELHRLGTVLQRYYADVWAADQEAKREAKKK